MALAILTFVLSGSATLATRAFQMAQTAGERTGIANAAQQQLEALRALRDNHQWDAFLNGQSSPYAFPGVLLASSVGCHKSAVCFHMESKTFGAFTEYVPVSGPAGGPVPTSYVEIKAIPIIGAPPTTVDFIVSYGFKTIGGLPDSENAIRYRLTDLSVSSTSSTTSYIDCASLAGAGLPFFYNFIGSAVDTSGSPIPFHVWYYHNTYKPPHPASGAPGYTLGSAIPAGSYTYWEFAKDNSPNPGSTNRSLHYIFTDSSNNPVGQTADTPPMSDTALFSPVLSGTINLTADAMHIQAEHGPKDPNQPDVDKDSTATQPADDPTEEFDDSLDGGCLALQPLP